MLLNIMFVLVLVADILATVYDVVKTEQGLKKGVAGEGNEIVGWLFGAEPGALWLYLWNFAFIGLLATAAIVWGFHYNDNGAIADGLFFSLIPIDAFKHYMGGRKWRILMAGGKIKEDRTAWEKFLGFGVTLAG